MDEDSGISAKKRIASARKKLQEYKAQRAVENNNNPSLSSAESNENLDGHSEPDHSLNMPTTTTTTTMSSESVEPGQNQNPNFYKPQLQSNKGLSLSPPPTSGFQHSNLSSKNHHFNYGISQMSTPLHPTSTAANYFIPSVIPHENNETFSLTHPPPSASPNTTTTTTTSTNQFKNNVQQSATTNTTTTTTTLPFDKNRNLSGDQNLPTSFSQPQHSVNHHQHHMRLSDYDASSSFLRDKNGQEKEVDEENDQEEEVFKPVTNANNDVEEHSNTTTTTNRTSLDLFGHLNKLYGDKGSHKAEENNQEIVKNGHKSEFKIDATNKSFENSAISPILRPVATSTTTLNTIKRAAQLHNYDDQVYNPQVQEAIELQLSELRKDNLRLQSRESELIGQLENSEKCINDLRRERNNANEIARREIGPLQHKLTVQIEENNRLKDKLTLKEKQFEEMEQAFIVVSNCKMELSAQLDLEREKYCEEKARIPQSEIELLELRKYFEELQVQHEKTKLEFGAKLADMESKKRYFEGIVSKHHHHVDCPSQNITENGEEHHDHQYHHHGHENENETHSEHSHEHHHDHDHNHDHQHEHGDHSHEEHGGPTEMEKTLKRLEWENQNYLSELEKLVGVDQERRELKIKLDEISRKNQEYLVENQRLDHLIIQLQGENDTIGKTSGGVNRDEANPKIVTSCPLMWCKAIDIVLEKLRYEGVNFDSIIGISGAGQQHGSVFWKKGAQKTLKNLDPVKFLHEELAFAFALPYSPIWMDSSTTEYCEKLESAIGGPKELSKLTGSKAYERFTGSQIAKIFHTKKEVYNSTERISLVSSFACSIFLGDYAPIDYSDGCGMNLLDIRTKKWSKECVEAITGPNSDILAKLGDPVATESVLGNISNYFVERFGFNPNCKIVAFTGDNSSSFAGMGLEPNDIAISLGTSDTVFLSLDNLPKEAFTEGHIFSNPVSSQNSYMALLCFKNGSLTRERICKETAEGDWDIFNQLLDSTTRGNFGNIAFYFDFMEIIPKVKAGNYRFNKDGTKLLRYTSKEVEVRALIEGQFLSRRVHCQRIGCKINENTRILATGGASSNEAILQVLADVFCAPVYTQKSANSADLGACFRVKHAMDLEKNPTLSFGEVMKEKSGFVKACDPSGDAAEIYNELAQRYAYFEEIVVQTNKC